MDSDSLFCMRDASLLRGWRLWVFWGILCLSGILCCFILPRMTLAVMQADEPDYELSVDEVVATGFSAPVQVTHAGDGSGRLFVLEQSGAIRIIKQGQVLPDPFLDVANLIVYGGERGLLGLAFHPDYAQNGYFYIDYTRAEDGATVVARYTVSPSNPDQADPHSAMILLTIAQPYVNHNGGQLHFSPADGYLYIGTGDGGSAGDPQNYAQDPASLLGKLLRLDVDGDVPYAIPPDNPYVGQSGRDEIWALGLRNPWRFSFDRETGDVYIGDVGQNAWEEIDYQAVQTSGGVNFGWRCMEGTHEYNFSDACASATLTPPIAEYAHSEGRSVTGGFVYRGRDFPALIGRYFYADYVSGKIWSLSHSDAGGATSRLELETGLNISAFGEDERGEVYIVDHSGTLRRLVDLNGPIPNLTSSYKQASTPSADVGETVVYTLALINTGGPVAGPIWLTDTLPVGLDYVTGSLSTSQGDTSLMLPFLFWQGELGGNMTVTLTYQVRVNGAVTGSLVNWASATGEDIAPLALATSLAVPRTVLTSTRHDVFFPGTQPEGLHADIAGSVDCDICHTAPVYDQWRGSMMSQSGRDVLMWAALAVANVDAPDVGDYCLRCHAPSGWLAGRSHPADGSALQPQDLNHGVACALCHRMVSPVSTTVHEASSIDMRVREALTATVPWDYVGSSTLIVDPEDNRRGPFSFTPDLPYHTAYQTEFLGQASDRVARARLCGTCHNLDNPLLSWDEARQQYWPNTMDAAASTFENGALFPIERTFDEWLYSDYARLGVYAPGFSGANASGIVGACQDCHLPRAKGVAVEEEFGAVYRDCVTTGCLPQHTLVGGNTWLPLLLQDTDWHLHAQNEAQYLMRTTQSARTMLRKAARMQATLSISGTEKIAQVRVFNQTGHKLPTGYPEGRQMWLNVRAYDEAGALLYESGAYDWEAGRLIRDEHIKVYEVKQGITPEFAARLNQPAGASFHFVLNNTIVKDNRIPPKGYTQGAYDRPGLRPVGTTYVDGQYWDDTVYSVPMNTAKVEVALYYQVASKEYIEFLQRYGGVDGKILGSLWETSKSPPEVLAQTAAPLRLMYLPLLTRQ